MEKPSFKSSITVLATSKKPYLLQVAMWNGDKYICHEYRFDRRHDTVQLFMAYLNANDSGEALKFHFKYLDEVARIMRLPIHEGRDEPFQTIPPPLL